MTRTSLAIGNLRAFVILLVVSFHSTLAYLASQSASPLPFDSPPYDWRAIPLHDSARWFGFDLYGAFQYVFLMPFMFLLSGLFVWPSLVRKGARVFLYNRSLRIGVPFVLTLCLLMPVTFYPAYWITATDPSWSAYWTQWMALPFWPDGPLWFLWQILLLDIAAAALFRFAPRVGEFLGRLSIRAGEFPGRYFVGFAVISALAYLPLASIFKPWDWGQFGPFSFQPGRLLHYTVYFFAGLGIGVNGIERARRISCLDGRHRAHDGRSELASAASTNLRYFIRFLECCLLFCTCSNLLTFCNPADASSRQSLAERVRDISGALFVRDLAAISAARAGAFRCGKGRHRIRRHTHPRLGYRNRFTPHARRRW